MHVCAADRQSKPSPMQLMI